jgi:hypothetical protein
MSLMPTLLIGNWRESALFWTSAMTVFSGEAMGSLQFMSVLVGGMIS